MTTVEEIEKCSNAFTDSFYTQYLQNGRNIQNYFINSNYGFVTDDGSSVANDYDDYVPNSLKTDPLTGDTSFNSFQGRTFYYVGNGSSIITDSFYDCFDNKGDIGYFSNLNDPDLSYSGIGLFPVFTRPPSANGLTDGEKVYAYFVYSGRYI
jgi:hypothetical protein